MTITLTMHTNAYTVPDELALRFAFVVVADAASDYYKEWKE